jgi:hypothetical protein
MFADFRVHGLNTTFFPMLPNGVISSLNMTQASQLLPRQAGTGGMTKGGLTAAL